MKKILLVSILLLAFGILQKQTAYAQQATITPNSSPDAMIPTTPTPTQIDYTLPYPGLLPDSPLYKLKTLRDKIIGFLISDPLKRAEFDILQADKRNNAALFLFKENPKNEQLISDTLSKSDNYFEEALGQLNIAKKQGEDSTDMTNKAFLSNLKHLEIIHQIELSASSNLKKGLLTEEKRIQQFENTVNGLIKHK